jgi:hypothetical protein
MCAEDCTNNVIGNTPLSDRTRCRENFERGMESEKLSIQNRGANIRKSERASEEVKEKQKPPI